ncbi:homeobox protein Mohawk-like isoform X5 [Canis aureus]
MGRMGRPAVIFRRERASESPGGLVQTHTARPHTGVSDSGVSNWFANARRRLKNTVRQPDLSWALRIKLYNKYVQGNAERLSVSSDDSCSEDGENPPRNHINEGGYNNPVHHPVTKSESSVIKAGVRPESQASEDYVSPPEYKSSLLNRYLNDSLRHVMATNAAMMGKTRQRNHSGSFSSNEFEEELVSPSSSETEGNFVYRTADEL